MHIDKKRHIAKTITYRMISSILGFVIVYIISGSVKIGASFGAMELIYKPIQYYIHERIWYKYISFGVQKKSN